MLASDNSESPNDYFSRVGTTGRATAEARNRAKDELKRVMNSREKVQKWEKQWVMLNCSTVSVLKWVPVSHSSKSSTIEMPVKAADTSSATTVRKSSNNKDVNAKKDPKDSHPNSTGHATEKAKAKTVAKSLSTVVEKGENSLGSTDSPNSAPESSASASPKSNDNIISDSIFGKKSASQGQQEDGSISQATGIMTSVPNENLELGSSKSAAKVEKRKDAGIKVDVANTSTKTGTELTERRGEKRKKSGESTAAVSEASDATEDDSNEQPPAKKALINTEEVEDDEH